MTPEATPKKPQEPASAYSLAATVARNVELHTLTLLAMSAELEVPLKEAVATMTSGEVEAALDWKTSHLVGDGGRDLTVLVDYKVRICPRNDTNRALLSISAKYQLGYELKSQPPEEERGVLLGAFASINGVYNSWPYLREIVQSSWARMTLPPVLLPVYRAQKPPERHSEMQTTLALSQQDAPKTAADAPIAR